MASDPSVGMRPITFPMVLPLRTPRISMALPKAPMGPVRMARPKDISPITPVKPSSMTNMK